MRAMTRHKQGCERPEDWHTHELNGEWRPRPEFKLISLAHGLGWRGHMRVYCYPRGSGINYAHIRLLIHTEPQQGRLTQAPFLCTLWSKGSRHMGAFYPWALTGATAIATAAQKKPSQRQDEWEATVVGVGTWRDTWPSPLLLHPSNSPSSLPMRIISACNCLAFLFGEIKSLVCLLRSFRMVYYLDKV